EQPVLPQQVFGLLIILQQFVQYFIGNSHSFLSSQLSLATYTIIFTAPLIFTPMFYRIGSVLSVLHCGCGQAALGPSVFICGFKTNSPYSPFHVQNSIHSANPLRGRRSAQTPRFLLPL
ncbi:MAG TPA: hypothetical protein VGY98_09330, partial [Verrucomicrobiae bacterium]|nr:hypothetical protein [Verrucomicrobiae bacterium]